MIVIFAIKSVVGLRLVLLPQNLNCGGFLCSRLIGFAAFLDCEHIRVSSSFTRTGKIVDKTGRRMVSC